MATSGSFTQYDKKWASKKYGTKKSATYKNSGCAPTAIANIVYAWNKKITPVTVGNYIKTCKPGRTAGGATYWSACKKAIQHFGGSWTEYGVAFNLFKKLYSDSEKGFDSYGLMDVKGSRGGVTWTTGGHYISIRAIKKNGDNDFLLYIQDPGWRKHTGWYSYRKHLQGCIKLCAYVTSSQLNKSTTKTSTSTASSTTTTQATTTTENNTNNITTTTESAKAKTKSELIVDTAKDLAWAYKTAKSTTVNKPKEAYKKALAKAFPNYKSYSTNYKTGKTCDEFVAIVMIISGVDTKFPRHRGLSWTEKNSQMLYLTNAVKAGKYKTVSTSSVQAGDIILYTWDKKGKKGHICIAMANGLVAEASAGDFYPRITKSLSTRLNKKNRAVLKVYRPV